MKRPIGVERIARRHEPTSGPARQAAWRSRYPRTGAMLLAASIAICGCGASSRGKPTEREYAACFRSGGRHCGAKVLSAARRGPSNALGVSHMGPILARLTLGRRDVVGIVALRRCSTHRGCYEQLGTVELPVRYGYFAGHKHLVTLPSVNGPQFAHASEGERGSGSLDIVGEDVCVASAHRTRPYELMYGVLRKPGAVVTDTAGGQKIRVRRVALPADLHPEGVRVYALLPSGHNDLVVEGRAGKAGERERWTANAQLQLC